VADYTIFNTHFQFNRSQITDNFLSKDPTIMQSLVKYWINHFAAWKKSHGSQKLSADIARQCRCILNQRIISKSRTLPPDQIRGYARAYTDSCLNSIIDSRSDLRHIDDAQLKKIILQAKEILIETAVSDMCSLPPTVVVGMAAAA
jgi:hypothetical protein